MAASIASNEEPADRFSLQYPEFLRRGREAWRRSSIVERLAETCGASETSVREELWPALRAISSESLGGDSNDFDISLSLGLSAEDHLALHGLRANLKTSKALALQYEEAQAMLTSPGLETDIASIAADVDAASEESEPDPSQKKLDFF
jgi:hypothetical protein